MDLDKLEKVANSLKLTFERFEPLLPMLEALKKDYDDHQRQIADAEAQRADVERQEREAKEQRDKDDLEAAEAQRLKSGAGAGAPNGSTSGNPPAAVVQASVEKNEAQTAGNPAPGSYPKLTPMTERPGDENATGAAPAGGAASSGDAETPGTHAYAVARRRQVLKDCGTPAAQVDAMSDAEVLAAGADGSQGG